MLNELFHESVPVILHEDDLNAMYFSIENRSPFLDRELFEFCYRIPSRYLMRDGLAKVVLRDAMRGIVPERILTNPRKVGFNAPIFSFLDVHDPEVRSALLDRSPIFEHVRRGAIEELLRKPICPTVRVSFCSTFSAARCFWRSSRCEILCAAVSFPRHVRHLEFNADGVAMPASRTPRSHISTGDAGMRRSKKSCHTPKRAARGTTV